MAVRFWKSGRVDQSGDCWLWTGSIRGKENRKNAGDGYGQFSVNHISKPAHRVAWMLTYGEIPEGMNVLHRCHVNYAPGDITYRRCVRPDHLYLGTQSENTRDIYESGRTGEGQGFATRLSFEEACQIRERFAGRAIPLEEIRTLASQLGMSVSHIYKVALGYRRTVKEERNSYAV